MAPRPYSPLTWSTDRQGSGHTKSNKTSELAKTHWTKWTRLETCAPPLCVLPAVLTKVSSAGGPAPRPQRRGLGAEAPTGQQGPPQALTSMGRAVHNRRGAQTWHVQAGERKRRSPHQRLEHTTATSLLSLEFRAICTSFVLAFSIFRNNKEVRFTCLFLGTFRTLEGSDVNEH